MQVDKKYLVLKRADIHEALNETEVQVLQQLCQRIAWYRQVHGKAENQYLVLNIDDRRFADIITLAERKMEEKV